MLLKLSTARSLHVFMTAASDHLTGSTGLTLTITAAKNGAAFASITPVVTELATGWYSLALTTAHTDTLGDLSLHITGSGADPTDLVRQVVADLPGATVSSVTGAVGSVTGAVGSVTGNVGGNVVGSVASVTARVSANTDQLAGQTVTAAAGVTFPTSVASPTNITAGTITTVTNLTNAATAGDFTATMKTSIGTAVAASAVASVTGNVGGNVTGSVGSVVGAVGSVTGNVGGNVTGSVGSIATGGIAAASFAAGAINAAAIATDAIGAAELAADAATEIGTAVWAAAARTLTANTNLNDPSAATIAAAVWDLDATAHQTQGTFGQAIGDPAADTDSIWGLVNTNLDAAVSSRSTYAGGAVASVTGNVGGNVVGSVASVTARVTANTDQLAGQTVTAGTGVTFPSSVASPTNITAGTITTATNLTNAPTVGDFTAAMKTSLDAATPAVTVSDKTGFALTAAYDPAKTAAQAGDAMALTSGERTTLAASVWNALTSGLTTIGSIGKLLVTNVDAAISTRSSHSAADVWAVATRLLTAGTNIVLAKGVGVTGFNDLDAAGVRSAVGLASADLDTQLAALPTATENADAVWEEAIADHSGTVGSTAEALGAAGAAGDPWATALPGAYGAGSAGKIVGDSLDATISSRATQTSVDTVAGYVDTEVAAIKTKTDQLTFTTSNRIDCQVFGMQAGTVTASAVATDAIDADALAADAVAEIQSGLSTLTAAGVRGAVGLASANLDTQLDALPTAAETASAVWDEALAGHVTAGTAGADLAAVSDPWATSLPGAYGAGTAGNIVGNNLDVVVSTRSSHSAADVWAVGTRTLTSFGTLVSDTATAVWGAVTRTLSAGTNIVLAKGTGITGFNDLSAAQVNAEADTALADVGVTTTVTGRLDAAISTRLATSGYTAPDNTDIAAVKIVTDKLDTALELDGIVYRYTTNALAQAPSGSGASAADIADAVWDEAIADHQNVGSTGEQLMDSAAAGNPWNTPLEGAYTAADIMRINAAVLAGKDTIVKLSGKRATVTFRSIDDSADRVSAAMNGSTRETITLTP